MSIQSEIDRIAEAKADIVAATQALGTGLPDGAAIDEIAGFIQSPTVESSYSIIVDKGSTGTPSRVTYTPSVDTEWLRNQIYPIGSIYISVVSTSPAALFGGTWERIKDTFLLAAGDTYAAGSTGGEAEHTLTVAELPHLYADLYTRRYSYGDSASGALAYFSGNMVSQSRSPDTYDALAYGGTSIQGDKYDIDFGNDDPHNNMPPYLSVYCWKRVA